MLFFKAFTLLFSVGLGGLIKPLVFHLPAEAGETAFYLCLSIAFLVLAALDFWKMELPETGRRS
ncbi:MAG: hypothetical protein R6U70_10610 [Bacillota bacterium]